MACHFTTWISSPTDTVSIYLHGQCITTAVPFSADMHLGTDAIDRLGAVLVTTTWICMESCGGCTIAIVFDEVKLSAASSDTRIAVLADRVWECDIKVIVDAAVRTAQVHVKLNKTTCKIVRCFGACSSTTMDCPSGGRPLWTSIISREIRCGVWAIFRS